MRYSPHLGLIATGSTDGSIQVTAAFTTSSLILSPTMWSSLLPLYGTFFHGDRSGVWRTQGGGNVTNNVWLQCDMA